MARRIRYHHPGSFYHVMLRGNHGQDIFFSDTDRYNMCYLLQDGVERFGHRIHAYCFMKNHIHLLIQVGEISLSKIMQNLAFRYSQKINRKHKVLGHLFQGRFKAILIQEESYFIKLLRYIHRNPVRAGITDTPENYIWSSHNTYLANNEIAWLTRNYALLKFDINHDIAISIYATYTSQDEPQEELDILRKNFREGYVLGDDNFFNSVRSYQPTTVNKKLTLESIIEAVCNEFKIEKEHIISKGKSQKASLARALISSLAVDVGNISIINIAKRMNRDPTSISSLISRFKTKYSASKEIAVDMEMIKEKAYQIA